MLRDGKEFSTPRGYKNYRIHRYLLLCRVVKDTPPSLRNRSFLQTAKAFIRSDKEGLRRLRAFGVEYACDIPLAAGWMPMLASSILELGKPDEELW